MRTISFKTQLAIFATLIALASCQKDKETGPGALGSQTPTNYENDDPNAVTDRANCQHSITIPANSVDALAAALDNICTGGTIWLAAGLHTENAGVVIGKKVNIKGQEGAVLKIQTSPWVNDFTQPIDVALHFKFATNARLENIDIQPTTAIGGAAVVLENSGGTWITKNHFDNFQYTILVEKSPGVKLTNNVIAASTGWQTGDIPEALGITIVNGPGALIKGNEVSGGLFGIWPCDQGGVYQNNYTHHNYIGLILCKVPANGFVLPSGPIGAYSSSHHWTLTNNVSSNNFDAGYLVIDGAYDNTLTNNDASGNGTYDIELVGDSYRFGFLTPLSYNNVVHAGSFQNVTIKDCGQNNTVYGGVQVDTSVDACY